jgi:hypothetical protein
VRATPSSRSTAGAYPRRRRAFSMENARLFVQNSTRRRCSGGSRPSGMQASSHSAPAQRSGSGGNPERQHAAAGVPGDDRRQLRLRHVARAGQDEGLPHRLRPLQGQQEPGHEVVDEDGMVEGAARAHDRVAAARDGAEELEEPRLARAVDGAGPHHGHRQAAAAMEVEGEGLRLGLGGLVDIPGGDRRGLVGGRLRDVAVDAHRRGVNEPADPEARRGLEQPLGPLDVDLTVVGVRVPRRPVHRRHVDHRVRAFDKQVQRPPVGEVALDPTDVPAPRRVRGRPGQGRYRVPARHERRQQLAARVSGGPGESDPHGAISRKSAR